MDGIRWIGLAVVIAMMGCNDGEVTAPAPVAPQATVFTATGNITAKVDEFRNLLGPSNGGNGRRAAGRPARDRLGWRGRQPVQQPERLPGGLLQHQREVGRGVHDGGHRVPERFHPVQRDQPGLRGEFAFFSPTKIFSPIGSNQLDQLFQVAGQPTPAVVRAFGIVFSDVDLADKTTIQLFAKDGSSLGTYSAPVRSSAEGLSFVGVTYTDAVIARVRITLGTGALGTNVNDVTAGGTTDLVVLDNLIYGEPRSAF